MTETYEITHQILMTFVVLGFFCGVFAAVFATRFFEVVHLHRLVTETIYRLLLVCSKLNEDLEFISQLKHTELENQNFDKNSRRNFRKVDDDIVKKWKNGVIMTLLNYSPEKFRYTINFTNWEEAMRTLDAQHRDKHER